MTAIRLKATDILAGTPKSYISPRQPQAVSGRVTQVSKTRRIMSMASSITLSTWKSKARLLRNVEAHFIKIARTWTSRTINPTLPRPFYNQPRVQIRNRNGLGHLQYSFENTTSWSCKFGALRLLGVGRNCGVAGSNWKEYGDSFAQDSVPAEACKDISFSSDEKESMLDFLHRGIQPIYCEISSCYMYCSDTRTHAIDQCLKQLRNNI